MKIAKRLALILILFLGAILIIAAFVEKNYAVERQVEIEKPLEDVFGYIKYLKNQNNYSVWANRDPNMKKEYRGTDGQPGFVSAWDSDVKEVGKGEQEIIRVTANERVDYELRFFAPMQAVEPAYMSTEKLEENKTLVKWGFSGHIDYPFNLMFLFMDMEEMIGSDLQAGLDKLKEILESESSEESVQDELAPPEEEAVLESDGEGGLGEEIHGEEE